MNTGTRIKIPNAIGAYKHLRLVVWMVSIQVAGGLGPGALGCVQTADEEGWGLLATVPTKSWTPGGNGTLQRRRCSFYVSGQEYGDKSHA